MKMVVVTAPRAVASCASGAMVAMLSLKAVPVAAMTMTIANTLP